MKRRLPTQAELLRLGHRKISPVKALRAKCLDCCAGSAHEVRLCAAQKCPSWPFRFGRSPWRASKQSLAQQENSETSPAAAPSQSTMAE